MFMICSDMTAPFRAPDPDEDADAPAAWERALLDHQMAELSRLARMGMALAEAITQRATSGQADADPARAAMEFSRAARAVRMSFALQSRLIAVFKAKPRPASSAEEDDDDRPLAVAWGSDWESAAAYRKSEVVSVVRRSAEDAALDAETVERLTRETAERLETDDLFADIFARPYAEVIALICQDLGLEPQWPIGLAHRGQGATDRPRRPPPAGEEARASGGGGPPGLACRPAPG